MEHSAILLTCIKLPFVIKIFVLSIFWVAVLHRFYCKSDLDSYVNINFVKLHVCCIWYVNTLKYPFQLIFQRRWWELNSMVKVWLLRQFLWVHWVDMLEHILHGSLTSTMMVRFRLALRLVAIITYLYLFGWLKEWVHIIRSGGQILKLLQKWGAIWEGN